jgi:hypothetical protein
MLPKHLDQLFVPSKFSAKSFLLEGPLKGGPSAFGVKSIDQIALPLAVLKNSRQTEHIAIKEK